MFDIKKDKDGKVISLGIEGQFNFLVSGGVCAPSINKADVAQNTVQEYLKGIEESNKILSTPKVPSPIKVTFHYASNASVVFEIDSDLSQVQSHKHLPQLLKNFHAFLKALNEIKGIAAGFKVYYGVYRIYGTGGVDIDYRYRTHDYPYTNSYIDSLVDPMYFVSTLLDDQPYPNPKNRAFADGVFIYRKAKSSDGFILEDFTEDSFDRSYTNPDGRSEYNPYSEFPFLKKGKKTWMKKVDGLEFKRTSGLVISEDFAGDYDIEYSYRPDVLSLQALFMSNERFEEGLSSVERWKPSLASLQAPEAGASSRAFRFDFTTGKVTLMIDGQKVKIPEFKKTLGKKGKEYFSLLYAMLTAEWCGAIMYPYGQDGPVSLHLGDFDLIAIESSGKQERPTITPSQEEVVHVNASTKPCAYAFSSKLKTVIVDDDVEEIPPFCFFGCENLVEVLGGKNLKCIGKSAFFWCKSLKHFEPTNLEHVREYAFMFCENAVLPAQHHIESYGRFSLFGCVSIDCLVVPDDETNCYTAPDGLKGFASSEIVKAREVRFKVPTKVDCSDSNPLFRLYVEAEEVYLPEKLIYDQRGISPACRTFHGAALENCSFFMIGKPKHVYLNSPIAYLIGTSIGILHLGNDIGHFTVLQCDDMDIGGNSRFVKKGNGVFDDQEKELYALLGNVTQLDYVPKTLEYASWQLLISIDTTNLPERFSDEVLGELALYRRTQILIQHVPALEGKLYGDFYYYGKAGNPYYMIAYTKKDFVTNVSFHPDCKAIGPYAFTELPNLSVISVPSSVTVLCHDAFDRFKGSTIRLPDTLESIPERCFYYASQVVSVNMPSGLKKIGFKAFSRTKLVSIVVPSSVQEIGENAFEYMSCLRSFDNLSSAKVPDFAFYSCKFFPASASLDHWKA